MLDFWNGEHDVLVATTIIESGLDLPQVNTLIVERADLLGLAQLYQLRGRVGRSTPAGLRLPVPSRAASGSARTPTAASRPSASSATSARASSWRCATWRSAGRGASWARCSRATSARSASICTSSWWPRRWRSWRPGQGRERPPPEVRIDLPVEAHLPDDYVTDQDARLEAYRRLAAATTQAAVDDVVAEWVDRYGPLPERGGDPHRGGPAAGGGAAGRPHRGGGDCATRCAWPRCRWSPPRRSGCSGSPRSRSFGEPFFVRPAAPISPDGGLADFIRTMWPPDSE